MNLRCWFDSFRLEKIKLNAGVLATDVAFDRPNQDAAWELYVEMLTRVVTQPLPAQRGDEQAALDSVYSLFPTTREILRNHGRATVVFSKVAIPVLNQVVRPFTARWHRESLAGAFTDQARCAEFRDDLIVVQEDLRNYNRMLAKIAEVEDLTDLEQGE